MTVANEGVVFGEHLRGLRLARNLSQTELADRCNSNRQFIGDLERGIKIPSLTMVLRLADALECTACDLVEVFDRNRRKGRRKKR